MYDLKVKDIHCHIMEPSSLLPEQDFIAPNVENSLNILKIKKSCGFEALNIPAISLYEEPDLVCNPLALYAKYLAQKENETVFAFAGIRRYREREKNADMLEQAHELLACGFDGFKMICKPNARREMLFGMDDPVFYEFFEEAEKNQWPILYHIGDPDTFWNKDEAPDWALANGWYYGDDPRIPSYEELYEEIEDILNRYPKLKVTFAHFFFLSPNLERAQQFFDKYPNVRFDVTPGSEMYFEFSKNPEKTREFFVKNKGRILFGTDTVSALDKNLEAEIWAAQEKVQGMRTFFETDQEFVFAGLSVKGIHLDEDTCRELYSEAFDRFLGKSNPKKVSLENTQKLLEQYLKILESGKEDRTAEMAVLKQIREVLR